MGQRVLCFSKNIYEFQSLKQAGQFETVVRSLKSNMYKYLPMFSWRSANWLIGSRNIIAKYWSLEKVFSAISGPEL